MRGTKPLVTRAWRFLFVLVPLLGMPVLSGCPRLTAGLGAAATPTPATRDKVAQPPNRVPADSRIAGVNGTFGIQGQVRRDDRTLHREIRVSLLQGIGRYTTPSDDLGGYRFDGLKLGSYRLLFEADGYESREIPVLLSEGSISPPDQVLTSPFEAVILRPALATVSLPPPDNLQPIEPTTVRYTVTVRKRNKDTATASVADFIWTPSFLQAGVFRAGVDAATGPVTVVATMIRRPELKGVADLNVIDHPGETELQILSLPGGRR